MQIRRPSGTGRVSCRTGRRRGTRYRSVACWRKAGEFDDVFSSFPWSLSRSLGARRRRGLQTGATGHTWQRRMCSSFVLNNLTRLVLLSRSRSLFSLASFSLATRPAPATLPNRPHTLHTPSHVPPRFPLLDPLPAPPPPALLRRQALQRPEQRPQQPSWYA